MPAKDPDHYMTQPHIFNPYGCRWDDLRNHLLQLYQHPTDREQVWNLEEGVNNNDVYIMCWSAGHRNGYNRWLVVGKWTCLTCGHSFADGRDICNHCELDRQRKLHRQYSQDYRIRHGLVNPRFSATCDHCGVTFRPKRSTRRFCSSSCRLKAHRLKTKNPDMSG
jgi:predicted nucleic acid-binding Zn ribbon protein